MTDAVSGIFIGIMCMYRVCFDSAAVSWLMAVIVMAVGAVANPVSPSRFIGSADLLTALLPQPLSKLTVRYDVVGNCSNVAAPARLDNFVIERQ